MKEQTKTEKTVALEHMLCAKGLSEHDLSQELEVFTEGCDYQFGIILRVCSQPYSNGTCPYIKAGFTYNGISYYPCKRDIPKPKPTKRLE